MRKLVYYFLFALATPWRCPMTGWPNPTSGSCRIPNILPGRRRFFEENIFWSKMDILIDNEGLSHIALDIFTCLDPSSLAQARLVCKSWCLLITRSRVWWTSKLSQFKRKTKRIEGENGVWVLMPRNHERWNYWKKPIKHFMKKANLDYLERFTLLLINEVPFVEDKTAGNVAQLR